jgi:hypothetical protein
VSVFTGRLARQQLTDIARRMGGTLAVSVVLLTETAIDELITATAGLGEPCNVAEVAGLPWPEGSS